MKFILCCLAVIVGITGRAGNDGLSVGVDNISDPSADSPDVAHMLFGHIGDSYGWHITSWNGRHITIPLPCIVYSRTTRWHAFMSSRIEHGHSYKGFALAEEGRYKDKIIETATQVRPFDISITKNVASLMFTAILLISLILSARRW